MLHGVIPAAFFATLLRRYLDSISEIPQYSEASTPTIGCLETSAAIATFGIAAYGIFRLSRNKNDMEAPKIFQPHEKEVSILRLNRRPLQRRVTRKHKRKGDKWFLNHMKKYKSKYGQKINKLMNQFLGMPASEYFNTKPIDLDVSDDDELERDPPEIYENSPFGRCSENTDTVVVNGTSNDECVSPSKGQFEDDEPTKGITVERRVSSSLELKKLLRKNFEIQRRKFGRRRSSESFQSGYSSDSYKSGYSGRTISDVGLGRSSNKKSKSTRKQDRTFGWDEEKRRKKNPKTTRSGRCYNNLFS